MPQKLAKIMQTIKIVRDSSALWPAGYPYY